MGSFKAACVAWVTDDIPDWVRSQIEASGVEFVAQQCESSDQVVDTAEDADIVWAMGGSTLITAEIIPQLTRCGAIIRSGSGTDNIPVDCATQHGIIVANTPDATTVPVAEHALALLLSVVRLIPTHDRLIRRGGWNDIEPSPRFLLRGSTVGLVGFGRIARCVAERLLPFGVNRIIACDPKVDPEEMTKRNVQPVDLPQLLSDSDFISIHTPLLKETHHLIGEDEISQMKPNCVVINTSRGPVVDTQALAAALKAGKIAAAGLDVLESEPPNPDDPLIGLENTVLTSHIAARYDGHLDEFWRLSVETVIDLSRKKWPVSCVNPDVKPRWKLTER